MTGRNNEEKKKPRRRKPRKIIEEPINQSIHSLLCFIHFDRSRDRFCFLLFRRTAERLGSAHNSLAEALYSLTDETMPSNNGLALRQPPFRGSQPTERHSSARRRAASTQATSDAFTLGPALFQPVPPRVRSPAPSDSVWNLPLMWAHRNGWRLLVEGPTTHHDGVLGRRHTQRSAQQLTHTDPTPPFPPQSSSPLGSRNHGAQEPPECAPQEVRQGRPRLPRVR